MRSSVIYMSGLLLFLVAGCVDPDPSNPWSTKSKSASQTDVLEEEVVLIDDVQVRRVDTRVEIMPEMTERVVEISKEVVVEPVDTQRARVVDVDTGVTLIEAATEQTTEVQESLSVRERAIEILRRAAIDSHPLLRANAFEAFQSVPSEFVIAAPFGLADENRAVRFITALGVGDLQATGLRSDLAPLLQDISDSVRAAAIFAARRIGEPVDPTPLSEFLMSDDPEIRSNTYMVLARLGNPSAIPLIEESLGSGMKLVNPMRVKLTELQAADALVTLGDQSEVEPIRAALFAPIEQGELTILACSMIGEIGDGQAKPMLERLITAEGNQKRPPEIRIAAARALFMLGEPYLPGLEQVIAQNLQSEDGRLRVQSVAALAEVPGNESFKLLERMLNDSDPLVSTMAASAILSRDDQTP